MKFVFLTSGSRGDVQPWIALALEMKSAGHEVIVGAEERVRPLAVEFGLDYFVIAGDPTLPLYTKEGQKWLEEGKVMQMMKKTEEVSKPYYEKSLEDYEKACEGADAIISGALCFTQTYSISQKLKIPWIPVMLGPTLPTSEFPLFFMTQRKLPFGFMNRWTYSLMFKMLWMNEKDRINKWRTTKLKIPALTQGLMDEIIQHKILVIGAYNKNLIPGEKIPHDYIDTFKLTGFFFVPKATEESIDPKLKAFVEAGDPPLYLGFGSMPAPDPKKLLNIAIGVVKKLNIRAVLVCGWTEFSEEETREIPEQMLIIKSAPHDWLLSKCSCIVHHCGVGTTAAALRSGVPQVGCPVYLDQPWLAERVHKLGVGASPIQFQHMTVHKLTDAIESVLKSTTMKKRAQEIAEEIAGQNGVAAARDIIEQYVKTFSEKK